MDRTDLQRGVYGMGKNSRFPFKTRTMITAIAIVAFLALTCLLAFGTGWNNVLSPDRNELVFAGRNQAYGAYKIRQEHHQTMIMAMGIGLGLVGAGLLLPKLFADTVEKVGIAYVPIPDDVIFDSFEVEVIKPHDIIKPAAVEPSRPDPVVPSGILVAVDSTVTAAVDTSITRTNPGPGPKVGDPSPKGGDPGPKGGGPGDGSGDGDKPIEGYQADEQPEYPGGVKALYKYLGDEVEYPAIDVRADRSGRVVVGFVVTEDGTVSDATVLLGVSPTLDAEALRVVNKMKKWKPGKARGKDVKVRYKLPIVFKLAP